MIKKPSSSGRLTERSARRFKEFVDLVAATCPPPRILHGRCGSTVIYSPRGMPRSVCPLCDSHAIDFCRPRLIEGDKIVEIRELKPLPKRDLMRF